MNLKQAIRLVHDELRIGYPIHAYETTRYFVFTMGDNNWEPIANSATFVIDKEKREGKWIPFRSLRKNGLDETGTFIREYDEEDIKRSLK